MNKEYISKIHNIDTNYNEILSKTKGAGSMKKKILNIAAIFIVVIIVGTMSGTIYAKRQWDIQFKEYQNRDYGFASTAIANGYVENVDMDYVYQDDIGVKVNSLIVTDDHFESELSFKIPQDKEISSEDFIFGFVVYDDDNIYAFSNRNYLDERKTKFDLNYFKCLHRELGIEYDKNDIFGLNLISSLGINRVSASNNEIVSRIELEAIKEFPKSKKIYIRVFDLGFTMIDFEEGGKPNDIEEFNLSGDNEWIFEIEVPEQMYNRETTNLKLEQEIPDFELTKATITETKLVLQGTMKGLEDFIMAGKDSTDPNWGDTLSHKAYITDSDGNEYLSHNFGTNGEKNGFHADFDLNKFENNELYLHVKVEDEEVVRKLVKN